MLYFSETIYPIPFIIYYCLCILFVLMSLIILIKDKKFNIRFIPIFLNSVISIYLFKYIFIGLTFYIMSGLIGIEFKEHTVEWLNILVLNSTNKLIENGYSSLEYKLPLIFFVVQLFVEIYFYKKEKQKWIRYNRMKKYKQAKELKDENEN